MSPPAALGWALCCAALTACDATSGAERDDTTPTPVVPAGHPCPELALAPEASRRWDDGEVAPLALRLPTPPGIAVRVTQGNDGLFSHRGPERYAWDFGVELGTPVHAAAGGVVVWVEDGMSAFGPEPEHRDDANFVVVDHGGGLFSAYVHLAAGSARVLPGDVVAAGEILAETGLSGQMTGPHLHFHIENVWSESVPARFATPEGCTLLPAQDAFVTAWEAPLAAQTALSFAPPDAFSENGVSALEGLPARLFERDEHAAVLGRTTDESASEVWFLVLPPAGGTALFAQRFAVHAGRFTGRLDLRALAPGQYGVALVAGEGGPVSVPRSVRAAILN